MATKTTPKLNITNIKSPLGGAIGPVNKKFKSQTLSSALGNQPFRKAPKIDPLDTSSQTTAQVLSQTNSILLDIQTQLTFDFASRINKENKEINKIKARNDKSKKDSAESGVEAVNKIGKGIGSQFDKVLAPAKGIFAKLTEFFTILAGGFVLDKALGWLGKEENRKKISDIFTFLGNHSGKILAIIGGVVIFKIVRKLVKLYKGLRALGRFLGGKPGFLQNRLNKGKTPTPKPKPGGGLFRNRSGVRRGITTSRTIRGAKVTTSGGKVVGGFARTKTALGKSLQYVQVGAKKLGRNLFKTLGVGPGSKAIQKGVLKFIRPFLKRIPFIGVLIDFGLSVALGEDPGRAAFGAIGAGLLGGLGTIVGGPVGMLLGGLGGDWAGRKLYDLFFGGKKGTEGDNKKNEKNNKKIEGKNLGGTVTGKNVGNKDSELIYATVGEKIVNRKDSERFGSFIDDINSNGGELFTGLMSSIKEQELNNESFKAANAKLTEVLSAYTRKKDIKTTIPISTPSIASRDLKRPFRGKPQIVTLPTIKSGSGQSGTTSPPPPAGPVGPNVSAEDSGNSYLAYTTSELGIYGS